MDKMDNKIELSFEELETVTGGEKKVDDFWKRVGECLKDAVNSIVNPKVSSSGWL